MDIKNDICHDTISFGEDIFICQRDKNHNGLHHQVKPRLSLFWEHLNM